MAGRSKGATKPAESSPEKDATPPPKKKARVTAVGKAKTKGTIARVEDNFRQAQLLHFPGEIRERILRFLLGDKCVHVKLSTSLNYPEDYRMWGRSGNVEHAPPTSDDKKFECIICDVDPHALTAPSADTEEISGAKGPPTDDGKVYRHELHDHSQCHDRCLRELEPDEQDRRRQVSDRHVHLAVMRTCRQLYEEAHTIFWSTNTFVFDDAFSLPIFLKQLNQAQRRKLLSVHILARMAIPWRFERDKKGIDQDTVAHLPAIQNLLVDYHIRRTFNVSGEEDLIKETVNRLENLKNLNPDHVAVYLKDVTDVNKCRTFRKEDIVTTQALFLSELEDRMYAQRRKEEGVFAPGANRQTIQEVIQGLTGALSSIVSYDENVASIGVRVAELEGQARKVAERRKAKGGSGEVFYTQACCNRQDAVNRNARFGDVWREKIVKKAGTARKRLKAFEKMGSNGEDEEDVTRLRELVEAIEGGKVRYRYSNQDVYVNLAFGGGTKVVVQDEDEVVNGTWALLPKITRAKLEQKK